MPRERRVSAGGEAADDDAASARALEDAVDAAAHLLPAQGPISVFIHHNPLHAFEHLPFEEAVTVAAERFGCEPFLSAQRYREALAAGRISERDVDEALGAVDDQLVAGKITRHELRRRLAIHGVPRARGAALGWLLREGSALDRFRDDLPSDAREVVASTVGWLDDPRGAVRELWDTCVAAVRRSAWSPEPGAVRVVRHRDVLLAAQGIDIDTEVHAVLIRFTSAYLDQGLAHWPMPQRELGMFQGFLAIYRGLVARYGKPWGAELERLVAEAGAAGAAESLRSSLHVLGVPPAEWREFLSDTALALRGWAGMVRQLEERPDRVPSQALPARLMDFLAVRLLLERAALAHALPAMPLADVRSVLAVAPPRGPTEEERAWELFHVAQLIACDAAALDRLDGAAVAELEREIEGYGDIERRRTLHVAFERHLRRRLYDALTALDPAPPRAAPFQVVFCLDEREESFRRHLEEVSDDVETLGAAGFFGVAMYYRGAHDARPRPLCPVVIQPEHYVPEEHLEASGRAASWRRLGARAGAWVDKNVHIGSRTLVRGGVLMALLGTLWLIPLVLRVVFPWLTRRGRVTGREARTWLRLDRDETVPPAGRVSGFTVTEMADIVDQQLENLGIRERLGSLVLFVGHGSSSLNNPHESAHDCGACGGGHGGANARALAQMANDPRVREALASRGVHIPPGTWFVGAERNTASSEVTFFDERRVPPGAAAGFAAVRNAIDEARTREAHERCRRFDNVPAWFPRRAARMHVESRSADLAQPRPEYGHASNAYCVVGRRARTRSLFLDRRAFLVSYDAARDASGAVLARLLAAVVPVVAGINLEYYFGYVDPTGYGCGTKLPHNIVSLLGVMDGAESDLRTGLPWQMLEIHEPVRLTIVVECRRDALERVLKQNEALRRLVMQRWVFLAWLDPDSRALGELSGDRFIPHDAAREVPVVKGDSLATYRGRRGHIPVSVIDRESA